jgi:hypothetical protein
MRKTGIISTILCYCTVLWLSCGENENGNSEMDTSVIGYWEGGIEPLAPFGFNGARIFTRISGSDSSFTLASLTWDTAASIHDTTLNMAGTWRMITSNDSIILLLLPDTCRIIDTTLDSLVPREVHGITIPMPVDIKRNSTTDIIEWRVSFAELVPIAPLLGIELTGISVDNLKKQKITLFKRSQ